MKYRTIKKEGFLEQTIDLQTLFRTIETKGACLLVESSSGNRQNLRKGTMMYDNRRVEE